MKMSEQFVKVYELNYKVFYQVAFFLIMLGGCIMVMPSLELFKTMGFYSMWIGLVFIMMGVLLAEQGKDENEQYG